MVSVFNSESVTSRQTVNSVMLPLKNKNTTNCAHPIARDLLISNYLWSVNQSSVKNQSTRSSEINKFKLIQF